eukprot:gene294-529_t
MIADEKMPFFDVKEQIKKTVNHLKSYIANASTSFSEINKRLLESGHNKNGYFDKDNGMISSKGWTNVATPLLEQAQTSSFLYDASIREAPPLKKQKIVQKKTLGKGWFDLAPAELTDELKKDMKIIQLRNSLDPKRFYKNPDKMKNVLHSGTVIEGPTEYKSSRMTKRQRKTTIMDEILADQSIRAFSKRKYQEIQTEKSRKKKTYKTYKKLKVKGAGDLRREKLRKYLIR